MSLAGQIGLLAGRIATEIKSVRAALDTQTGEPTPEDFSGTFNGLLTTPPAAGTASETAAGVTQFATAAEVRAGTVANHAVSPLQLATWGAPVIPCATFAVLSSQGSAVPAGSLLAVEPYAVSAAINHVASLWMKGADGKVRPVSPIFIGGGTSGDPAGQGKTNAQSVLSSLVGYSNLSVPANTVLRDDYLNEFRLTSGSSVRCWNSDWTNFTPTVTGIAGSAGASPGWIVNLARYRYAAGRVEGTVQLTLNGATAALTGTLVIGTPTTFTSVGGMMLGIAQISDSSAGTFYNVDPNRTGATFNQMKFLIRGTNGLTANVNATAPMTWAQSDFLLVEFSYEVDS